MLLAGGKPVVVSIKAPADAKTSRDWALDWDGLERAVTPKSKIIIVNNPNNPLGKVWSREELEV